MSRNARILDAWPRPIFDQGVAMTDAAGLDFDSNLTGLWFRNFALHQLKGSFCVWDLDGTHFCRHIFLSSRSFRKTRVRSRMKMLHRLDSMWQKFDDNWHCCQPLTREARLS